MNIEIPLYFDFSSTLCYVAHRVLQRLDPEIRDLGISFDWRPIDLVRITGWPRNFVVDKPRRKDILRIASDLGIAARMPARWIDSRAAHTIHLSLRGAVVEAAWRERVWSAIFEEGRLIDEPGEIERLSRDLRADIPSAPRRNDDAIDAMTREAHIAGATGVPTFMFGEWPVGGIQEDHTMLTLLQRFARKTERERDS